MEKGAGPALRSHPERLELWTSGIDLGFIGEEWLECVCEAARPRQAFKFKPV